MEIKTTVLDQWTIIELIGEFVVRTLAEVRTLLSDLEHGPSPHVAIDLSKVTYLDSSALTLISNFHRRIKIKKGQCVLYGPTPDIQSILQIVGFYKTMLVYKDRQTFKKNVSS